MSDLEAVFLDLDGPHERPFQVIGLGLNAVDWICRLPHFPEHNSKVEIERLQMLGGGQTATACALCGRYGLKTRYMGRVGADSIGEFSLNDLRQESMDTSLVDVIPGASSQLAIILVDRPTGERTILWQRDPKLRYRPDELKRNAIVEGQVLHLDGHDQEASIQAAVWAREAGMKVSLDIDKVQPGVEELLDLTDFLFPTLRFVQEITGSRAWRRGLFELASTKRLLTGVTLGAGGAAVVWGGEIYEFPAIEVEPLDTTGAGDVFHGALLFALFQGWSLAQCLRFANAAAGLSCTALGARGGIPRLERVLARSGI